MDHDKIINILEKTKKNLEQIITRFSKSSSGLLINIDDEKTYRTIIIETCDLLNDYLGTNKYSYMIGEHYRNGFTGFLNTPNIHSIECVISVINSTITRFRRNPNLPEKLKNNNKDCNAETSLNCPEKVTVKWLIDNVPYRYYVSFVVLLFTAFLFGVEFAGTDLYKSIKKDATPNMSSAMQKINNKQ